MTQQLWEFVDAKLLRIEVYLKEQMWAAFHVYENKTEAQTEADRLCDALYVVRACRKDVKYEYLGLKDSWL